jgi:hypothetical protein
MKIILFLLLTLTFIYSLNAQTPNQNECSISENLSANDFFQFEKCIFQLISFDAELIKDLSLIRQRYAPNLPDEDHEDLYTAFEEWKNNFENEYKNYLEFLQKQRSSMNEKGNNY